MPATMINPIQMAEMTRAIFHHLIACGLPPNAEQ
jgi:hypothetical protein